MVVTMYKHLLIATDGSDLALKAIHQGLALAKALGAAVTMVHVTLPWSAVAMGEAGIALPPDSYDKMTADAAAQVLKDAAAEAEAAGVACDTVHIEGRTPAEGIIKSTRERGADLIVMASHGRSGLARLFLGSQASEVVSKSSVPVLVCR